MKTTKDMKLKTVWKLCIKMWDWIAEEIRAGSKFSVSSLKSQWCRMHGYELLSDCFFCDYSDRMFPGSQVVEDLCPHCPARAVAKTFTCQQSPHNYKRAPLSFHAKLHRMNKKRLAMKG